MGTATEFGVLALASSEDHVARARARAERPEGRTPNFVRLLRSPPTQLLDLGCGHPEDSEVREVMSDVIEVYKR